MAAGILCILADLGFERTPLGMLLPSNAATLCLSCSEMGLARTGSFTSGYCMAAAFARVAILPALFLRKPETAQGGDQRA